MKKQNLADEVATWWAANPQTYGDAHGGDTFGGAKHSLGTKEFFIEADRVFFDWNHQLHSDAGPFGCLFPYEKYRGKRVLEVGCGMGAMASQWARHGARISAIDLNPVAIAQTRQRFALFGLSGQIEQSDGRDLPFGDAEFDYAYSWGVLHHSPNLGKSIQEFLRVLKPGGEFGMMLYHRRSVLYWYHILFLEGFLHGERLFLDPLRLASRYTDGDRAEGNPHTWPVTKREVRDFFAPSVRQLSIRVFGNDIDGNIAAEIAPGALRVLPLALRKALARRFGWSLWISGVK